MATTAYALVVGTGTLYIAPYGTAAPAVDATPGVVWSNLGDFKDNVKFTMDQNIVLIRTKNRTGSVKATRVEEGISVETVLADATLENLSTYIGNLVVDTPPGVGTIGTRKMQLHRGLAITEFAMLWKGNSPYGDWKAQYYMPRGIFEGPITLEGKNDDSQGVPVKFTALEDLAAGTDAERFGYVEAQDAAAL